MVIFISGSINSGKSTVSKLLSEKIGNSAILEIDELRNFIEWMPLEDASPINWENAVALIKNFVGHSLNVIVPYPISQKNYDKIIEKLKDLDTKTYFFTLNPSLESILKNRGNRELNEWEVSRIKYHYKIGINNPSFGDIIDNTNEHPLETVDKILSKNNLNFYCFNKS